LIIERKEPKMKDLIAFIFALIIFLLLPKRKEEENVSTPPSALPPIEVSDPLADQEKRTIQSESYLANGPE
jgi:hypothetical protein